MKLIKNSKMKLCRKSAFAVAFCMILLLFPSCQQAPDQSLRASSPASDMTKQLETNNRHLKEMPETVSDVCQQGNLSLPIEAQVVPVSQEEIYEWDSTHFEISNPDFQKKLATALLGDTYKAVEGAREGNQYESEIGRLSIIPEKNYVMFHSAVSDDIDQSNENVMGEEGLDNQYSMKTQEIASALGLPQYAASRCLKFGESTGIIFYTVAMTPIMEGLPIKNSGVQPEDIDSTPPYEEIIANYGEDGSLWSFNMRVSSIDEASRTPVTVISLEKALGILKTEGMAVLSREIANSEGMTVNEIYLAYAHLPKGDNYRLTPVWMFSIESRFQSGGEEMQREILFAVNAVTSEIV